MVFWSPGLVVKGQDSYSRGREFASQHRLLPYIDIIHMRLLPNYGSCLKTVKKEI